MAPTPTTDPFRKYSAIIGVAFLLLSLVFVFVFPCPTSMQYNILRFFMAAAMGAFAALLTGTVLFKKGPLRASGGLAILVLSYLYSPAGLLTTDDCRGAQQFRGTVYIDDKETAGVEVIIPSLGKSAQTDGFGNFSIEYASSLVQMPLQVRFKYKTLLDTSLSITEIPKDKPAYRFSIASKVSATVSVSGHQISFANALFSATLSVGDTYMEGRDMFMDSVQYKLQAVADTIDIYPYSGYFEKLQSGEVIAAGGVESDISMLGVSLPQLDFKLVNNAQDAVFLTEAVLDISNSSKDNSALILFASGVRELHLYNAGWGKATQVKVAYNVVPSKDFTTWNNTVYETKILGTMLTDGPQAYKELNVDNCLRSKGVAEAYFDDRLREPYFDNVTSRRQITGDFTEGGTVYGTIYFTHEDGRSQQIRFTSTLDLWLEGGAGVDASTTYNTLLKAEGNNYQVSIPLSQGIPPKDFDRFFLNIKAPQTSQHVFKLKLLYNTNEVFEFPVVFRLHFFNTPESSHYSTKNSTVRG